MAIEQSNRTQLACKIVDLRKLRCAPLAGVDRVESPAAAEEVDTRIQIAKVKSWAERKQRKGRIEQELQVYYREASILASLNHVAASGKPSSRTRLTFR